MRTKLKDTACNFLLNELLHSRFPEDIDSLPANISQSDMSPANFLILFLLVLPLYVIILTRKARKKLPPGSFGLPFIGQSLSFLHALRTNTAEHWLRERVRKYGAVSKMNLLGTPTLLLHGQAANKFVYTCDQKILAGQQPTSIRKICGERNILELTGDDHRCVRGALLSFLKPEVLKQYVGKIDEEIRKHMKMHWHGKEQVQVRQIN